MLKKLISLLLVVLMFFCVSACSTTETSSESKTDTLQNSNQTVENEQENSEALSELEGTEDDAEQTDNSTDSVTESTVEQTGHIHSFSEATCTLPAKCLCGEVVGAMLGHTYIEATCTTPKTCTRCGEQVGLALEHSYSAATCTTPKTCIRCGNLSGEALGHKHIVATCTSPEICERCNQIFNAALGHDFQNGACTRCGKLDRTYLIEDIDYLKAHDDLYYSDESVTDNKGVVYSQHYNFHSNTFAYSRSIYFDISGKYKKFVATSLLPYEKRDTSYGAVIKIYGDETLLYQTPLITMGYTTSSFSVDVTGVTTLRIEMESSCGNINKTSCVPYLTDAYLEK